MPDLPGKAWVGGDRLYGRQHRAEAVDAAGFGGPAHLEHEQQSEAWREKSLMTFLTGLVGAKTKAESGPREAPEECHKRPQWFRLAPLANLDQF